MDLEGGGLAVQATVLVVIFAFSPHAAPDAPLGRLQ